MVVMEEGREIDMSGSVMALRGRNEAFWMDGGLVLLLCCVLKSY